MLDYLIVLLFDVLRKSPQKICTENCRTYCSQKGIIYSFTIFWYVFPLFENMLTKKH